MKEFVRIRKIMKLNNNPNGRVSQKRNLIRKNRFNANSN